MARLDSFAQTSRVSESRSRGWIARQGRRCAIALALVLAICSAAPKPAAAAPTGKLWTLYILGGGAVVVEGVKLLIDNANADGDGKSARTFIDSPPPVAAPSTPTPFPAPPLQNIATAGAFVDEVSWTNLRKALLVSAYTESVAHGDVYTTHETDTKKPPKAADLLALAISCANLLVYAKADGKLDCTSWLAKDTAYTNGHIGKTLVDATDAKSAFDTAPSMQQQIVNANVSTYTMQNRLRLAVVKLLAIRAIQGFNPGSASGDTGSTSSTFSLQSFVADCATPASLSTVSCIQDIGKAETQAATAHRAAVACSFAASFWLPSASAIANSQMTVPASPPTWFNEAVPNVYLTDVADPTKVTLPNYGSVPGC